MKAPHFGVGLAGGVPLDQVASLTSRIEAMGFDDLWIPDERFERDVFVSLAIAAQKSQRLGLSTCVTDPYIRHPMLTAVAIASLDELSNGRARVAMGAGLSGFSELGIDRRRPATAIREAVSILRLAWTGNPVVFEGEILSCKGAKIAFPCRSDIPIYVAGRGPGILRAGGEVADGVMIGTFASQRTLGPALESVDTGLARAGRHRSSLDVVSWLYVSISEDAEQARLAVRRPVAVALWGSRPILQELGIAIPKELDDLMNEATYSLAGPALDSAADLVPLELVEDLAVAGTLQDVRSQLQELLDIGVSGIAAWLHPARGYSYDDTLEAFYEVVGGLSGS